MARLARSAVATLACAAVAWIGSPAAQESYGSTSHPEFDAQGSWPAPVPSLVINDISRYVVEFVPAGGPMFRFASRPGAWYALVHLSIIAPLPAQLWLWLPADARDVHVTVLDRPPGAAPTAGIPLPMRPVRTGARLALSSVPFALPVGDGRARAFALVEQRNPSGARPFPVWMQLRSMDAEPWGDGAYAYVAPWDGLGSTRGERGPTSPLQTPRYYGGGLLELPFGAGGQPPGTERAAGTR